MTTVTILRCSYCNIQYTVFSIVESLIVVKTKRHAVSVSHLSVQMHDGTLDRHFKAPFHLVLKKQNELHVHTCTQGRPDSGCML